MGKAEVSSFLTHLAVEKHVASSTRNQALSALLFLYRHVLEQQLEWLDGVVRAKRPCRLPVVNHSETRALIALLKGTAWLRAEATTPVEYLEVRFGLQRPHGGRGKVYLRGGTFLSGTIRLKRNVTLYIEAGATLLGSTNIADYIAYGKQHNEERKQ